MGHPVMTPPRELSQEEHEQLVERCQAISERILAGLRAGRMALWATAEALYEFDEESGWKVLGFEHLGEWLAQPEVTMPKATYYALVRSWRTLVVHRKVDAKRLQSLDETKVRIVLPALQQGKALLDDALSDAETLAASDLREKYLGRRKGDEAVSEPEDGSEGPSEEEAEPEEGHVAPETDMEPVEAADVEPQASVEVSAPEAALSPPEPSIEQIAEVDEALARWQELYRLLLGAERSRVWPAPYTVRSVSSGLEALAFVLEHYGAPVDLILDGGRPA